MAGKGALVGARNSRSGSFLLATRCLTPSPFPSAPLHPLHWSHPLGHSFENQEERMIDVCLSTSQGCGCLKRAVAKMSSNFYPGGEINPLGLRQHLPCVSRESRELVSCLWARSTSCC